MNAIGPLLLGALVVIAGLAPVAAANGIGGGPPGCVGSSLGNDNGYWVCLTPGDPDCVAYLVRETIWGTWETCLVPRP